MRRMARDMMQRSSQTGTAPQDSEMTAQYVTQPPYKAPTPLVRVEHAPTGGLDPAIAPFLISATFRSRTGGDRPHVVTRGIDSTIWCTCRSRVPCWAVTAFMALVGE